MYCIWCTLFTQIYIIRLPYFNSIFSDYNTWIWQHFGFKVKSIIFNNRYLYGSIKRSISFRWYSDDQNTCPGSSNDRYVSGYIYRYLSDDILWLIRWYLTIIKRMNNNIQTHIQKQHCNSRRNSHFSKYVNGWLTWAVGFWQTLLYMVSMFTRQLAIVDTFSRTKELQCNITVSLKTIMGASTRLQNTW